MDTKNFEDKTFIFLIIENENAKTELDFFNSLATDYQLWLLTKGIKILAPLAINPLRKKITELTSSTKLAIKTLKEYCSNYPKAKVILVCDNDHHLSQEHLKSIWTYLKGTLRKDQIENKIWFGLYPDGKTIEYLLELSYPKKFHGALIKNGPFKNLKDLKQTNFPGNLKRIEAHFQKQENYVNYHPVEELIKNIHSLKLTYPVIDETWQICWSQIFK